MLGRIIRVQQVVDKTTVSALKRMRSSVLAIAFSDRNERFMRAFAKSLTSYRPSYKPTRAPCEKRPRQLLGTAKA